MDIGDVALQVHFIYLFIFDQSTFYLVELMLPN